MCRAQFLQWWWIVRVLILVFVWLKEFRCNLSKMFSQGGIKLGTEAGSNSSTWFQLEKYNSFPFDFYRFMVTLNGAHLQLIVVTEHLVTLFVDTMEGVGMLFSKDLSERADVAGESANHSSRTPQHFDLCHELGRFHHLLRELELVEDVLVMSGICERFRCFNVVNIPKRTHFFDFTNDLIVA